MYREWFPGEYFPHGHDCAFPAIRWNKLVERRTSLGSPLDLAFFHGGIGDARHLYQQLHNIYAYKIEWQRGIVSSRYPVDNIFFAVQDIKPHIIARNMMVFRLLHDISTIPTRIQSEKAQKKEHELLLAAVWYVYGCEIMPVYIHKLLVSMMKAMIRSAGNFQIPWVRCNTKTTAAIVSVFEGWLENQNLDGIFGIAYMQDKNTLGKRLNEYHGPLDADWWPYSNISRSLHFEHDQYQKTRLVYPPPLIMKDEEPELTTIFLGNDESLNNIELIKEYARKNWVPNFTRIADAELYEGQ